MGLKGDLTAGEIVEQLVHATRAVPVRNVVFMVSANRQRHWWFLYAVSAVCSEGSAGSGAWCHILVSTLVSSAGAFGGSSWLAVRAQ